jgi:ABC-2 type transport system permease protein
MTTPSLPSLAVRGWDVLVSEWTKFHSVRSTYWTMLVALVTPIAASALVAAAIAAAKASGLPPDPLLPGFVSLEYAVIAVGILGILTFTAEYTSGLIRTTFTAVPRRWAVLAAKAAVTGVVTLLAGELVAFASFFGVQAILSGRHEGVSLTHPGVAGAVAAEGMLLCVCAMTGVATGAVVRHTGGAIAALAGLLFLPTIVGLLPAPWDGRIGRFTLFYAARQVTTLHPSPAMFAPALSLAVLLAWPAVTLIIAALVLNRRGE